MFRPSFIRMRAWLELAEDVLGDPPAAAQTDTKQLHNHVHPHRRPLRWERVRRPGTVPAAPAHCLSPVRRATRERRYEPRP